MKSLGFIKQIWVKDESLPILQKMMMDGITLSDWINEKIQEYDKKTVAFDVKESVLKMMNPETMEPWQNFQKREPSLASKLKNMRKEELEIVLNDNTIDEATKSFARVFLKKLK